MHRPDPWREAWGVYREIQEDPEQRKAVLERLRAEDPELERRVQRLIERSGLGTLGGAGARRMWNRARLAKLGVREGHVLGGYELVRPLDSGGSSEIWIAKQSRPVERLVALKLLLPLSPRWERIMEREARALAQLSHPDIAKVYGAGVHDTGEDRIPWIALEYFEGGQDLVQFTRELPLDHRLDLFLRLCTAISYAHGRGIYHLDIKPGNVLVRRQQELDELCVIDFGIADSDGGFLDEEEENSLCGAGTMPYASPEQLAGESGARHSSKSDVYSLSVLLHQMLTGHLPFDMEGLSLEEASERAGTRGDEPAFDAVLPVDAAWVCHTGLHRARERRYASVEALAAEVQLLRSFRPVQAMPRSLAHRGRLFLRRNRRRLRMGSAAGLVLAAGFALYDRTVSARETELLGEKQSLENEIEQRDVRDQEALRLVLTERDLEAMRERDDPAGLGLVVEPPGLSRTERLQDIADKLLEPVEESIEDLADVEERMTQAKVHLSRREPAKALEILPPELLEGLEQRTEDVVATEIAFLMTRANALQSLGRLEETLALCDRAIALQPETPHYHANRASILNRMGRSEEAIAAFERVRELAPDDPTASFQIAGILFWRGEYEAALLEYDRAIEVQPDLAIHWSNRGAVLERLLRNEEALASFKTAHELAPTHAGVAQSVANCSLKLRRLDEALAFFDLAISGLPPTEVGFALAQRGQVHKSLGQYEAAIRDFRASMASSPPAPEADQNLTAALAHAGRWDEALDLLGTIRASGATLNPGLVPELRTLLEAADVTLRERHLSTLNALARDE